MRRFVRATAILALAAQAHAEHPGPTATASGKGATAVVADGRAQVTIYNRDPRVLRAVELLVKGPYG